MENISIYTMKLIREHKLAKVWPIWKVLPITKRWIGLPKIQYCILWGEKVLAHFDTYKDAVYERRRIWNAA